MRSVLVILMILLLLIPAASADGMIFVEDYDMWHLQPEENQLAAIQYENGRENLLISVSPGNEFSGNQAVWIVPVPAKPDTIRITILKGFPNLHGTNLEDSYTDAVGQAAAAEILYATFPLPILCGGPLVLSTFIFGMAGSVGYSDRSGGVEVWQQVERMGVTTEVVT
ncbi:MAG: hypothetical protein GYA23_04895, partial [Methanomicrobiales archaeon]|nr:hypothetical protein [Methanomicrobiales archaeon]